MKSLLKMAAASLTLAALAAVSSPVFAAPARVELSVANSYGHGQQQAVVPPGVVYAAPAPLVRYQDDNGWRQQQWREHAWREHERRAHFWRERDAWRERQWHEQRGGAHDGRENHRDRDQYGAWR